MILINVPFTVPSGNSSFLHSVLVLHTVLRVRSTTVNRLVFMVDMKFVFCEGENESFYTFYATVDRQIINSLPLTFWRRIFFLNFSTPVYKM
jgi:hypothetical protein